MTTVDEVRNKVQRTLTQHGRVEIDRDGDFILRQDSAVMWVSAREGFGDIDTLVTFTCPLIKNVRLTNDLFRWVATEGQNFWIGRSHVIPDKDSPDTGSVWFEYAIVGDDLDESELMQGVLSVLLTSNDLDNMLRDKFGGELFGSEK